MSALELCTDQLRLNFDRNTGAVDYVAAHDWLVLRGISVPVRDSAWATIAPTVSACTWSQSARRFSVEFAVRCRSGDADFRWTGRLLGDGGRLEFAFEGEALTTFRSNRIGFCVLHPASVAGEACEIEHTDGTRERSTFPAQIAPHQPFRDLRAITHTYAAGHRAEIRLEGDTFETEDQRNWTDASFKTYSPPLAVPYPRVLAQGTRIRQRVTLRLLDPAPEGTGGSPAWSAPVAVEIALDGSAPRPRPRLGTVWNTPSSNARLLASLRTLKLDHLRIDLWPDDPAWRLMLETAGCAAGTLDASLEVALLCRCDPARDVDLVLEALAAINPPCRVARWLLFQQGERCTPPAVIAAARDHLRRSPFEAPIGGGAMENFAELNRAREIVQVADFTTYACNPQVHAFDTAAIIETLPIQAQTVEETRAWSPGKPVVVSPVSLTRRWRGGEPGAPAGGVPGFLPFLPDARYATDFAGAWIAGSVAALTAGGAASLTLAEAVGPSGLVHPDDRLTPMGRALAGLQCHAYPRVRRALCRPSGSIAGIAQQGERGSRVVLVNLRGEPVEILGWRRPLRVGPYASVAEAYDG